MKNFFKKLLPAILLMSFVCGSAQAQTKIATVDLQKVFDNYYKTKLAKAAIEERKSILLKDDKTMLDDFKKANDEYQQLLAQQNDQAISAEERDRRKQSAATKLKDLQDRKTAIDQYERQAQATLNEQLQRMHDKLLIDIQNAVNDKAKADGYTAILNTAANEINIGNTSIKVPSTIIYSVKEIDVTADILKQLNAGAPIDTTAPAVTMPSPAPMGSKSP